MGINPRCERSDQGSSVASVTLALTGWTNAGQGVSGTGPAAGDLVVIVGTLNSLTPVVSQTGGTGSWTIYSSGDDNSGVAPLTSWVAYRVFDGTETAPVFAFGASYRWSYAAMAITPDLGTISLDEAASAIDTASSAEHVPPAGTVSNGFTDISLILTAAASSAHGTSPITFSGPAGWTIPTNASISDTGGTGTYGFGSAVAFKAGVTGNPSPGSQTIKGGSSADGTTTANQYHFTVKQGTLSVAALTDDFPGTSLDSVKWYGSASGGTVAVSGGQLVLTTAASGSTFPTIWSNIAYNLTGAAAYAELAQAPGSPDAVYSTLRVGLDGNNHLDLFAVYSGGTFSLKAESTVAGTTVNRDMRTYDPVAHRWLRIREQAGTVYWDVSADSHVWANVASLANPFAVTAIAVFLAGGSPSSTGARATIFDNFNVVSAYYIKTGGGGGAGAGTVAKVVQGSHVQLKTGGGAPRGAGSGPRASVRPRAGQAATGAGGTGSRTREGPPKTGGAATVLAGSGPEEVVPTNPVLLTGGEWDGQTAAVEMDETGAYPVILTRVSAWPQTIDRGPGTTARLTAVRGVYVLFEPLASPPGYRFSGWQASDDPIPAGQ